MAGEWQTAKIGDCFDLVGGYAFKSGEFIENGIPVIKIKNVKANRMLFDDLSYVAPEFLKTRAEKVVKKGDLLITMSGNRFDGSPDTWVGKVAQFNEDRPFMLNQRVGILRPKKGAEVDRRFFAFSLSSHFYQTEFIAIATSSGGQANLSPSQILGAPIEYPPLSEQKAIAAVLGALDDKIELNRRMNATLEAMARALFQSWFVDFDPVRAKLDGRPAFPLPLGEGQGEGVADLAALFPDSFQDSELGHIPKGWRAGSLGEFMQVGIGGAWGDESPDSKQNTAVRCLRGIDCHDLAERKLPEVPIRYLSERQFADRKLTEGCVLVEGSGSFCGRSMVWLSEFERLIGSSVCYSNFCKRLDPLCSPSQALICWMQLRAANDTGELANFRTGTAFPNLDIHGALLGLHVVCPPKEICDHYMELYRSWLRLDLVHESRTLATLRDTLLPKLLSGEIKTIN